MTNYFYHFTTFDQKEKYNHRPSDFFFFFSILTHTSFKLVLVCLSTIITGYVSRLSHGGALLCPLISWGHSIGQNC